MRRRRRNLSVVRIVIDTSVIIAGLRSRTGASAEILRRVLNGNLTAAVSTALLLEYEAVATREENLQAAGLTATEVGAVLDALAATMEQVPIYWRLRPSSVDPNDDLVIEAAGNAATDMLVTMNERDLAEPCRLLGIIRPSVLLSEIAKR